MTLDMTRTERHRQRLISLLEELFQLNQPDLDFGFYKIMHAKAQTVSDFLQKDLLAIIKRTFGEADEAKSNDALRKYKQAIETAKSYGANDPEHAPQVKEAKAAYEVAEDSGANEGEIYEHLYRFFERYYDNGDFMSRRYFAREIGGKAAPYAVPYDGREVYLHWANRDQYYIKTSEYLTNFTVDLTNAKELQGRIFKQESLKLHCRIVDASEGEHNNNKTTDKTERFFLIHADQPAVMEHGELVLQFEYRPDKDKSGTASKWQEKRIDEAESAIFHALTDMGGGGSYNSALQTEIGEDKTKRTLLRKYLNQYTKRNTSDYFIHKDLSSFLKRELDFYIKNEIMRLDDIESADAPQVETYLAKIKVLRKIAGQLITFLAQLENFQKKLWLKKKFVTDTQYCITLDRIPEEMYAEIAANDAQRKEWVKLFAIDEIQGDLTTPAYSEPLTVDFLKANPFLVLDTALFSSNFKDALMAEIKDFDENLDGLLIHSENFQALGLMQEKYKEQVKCIYIDPPYNTGNDGFIYKDSYQHSGWLSMMENRLIEAREKLSDDGVIFISIDDNEQARLKNLCDKVFGTENFVASLPTIMNLKGNQDQFGFAGTHELIFVYGKLKVNLDLGHLKINEENLDTWEEDEKGFFKKGANLKATGTNAPRNKRPNLFFPIYVSTDNSLSLSAVVDAEEIFPITNGEEVSWRWSKEKFLSNINDVITQRGDNGLSLYKKQRPELGDLPSKKPKSVFYKPEYSSGNGTQQIKSLFIEREIFSNPKPLALISDLQEIAMFSKKYILDYFAGSGTTGHAVINLNREDGGKRKYIMVEMGNYFDNVTKPRMQKVVYSKNWKDGKPVPCAESIEASRDGISHAFKYIRLESYEDTLNNLSFKDDATRDQALQSNDDFRRDYMLKYWLDVETKGSSSLLNIEQFDDPTGYTLTLKKPGSDAYEAKPVDLVETFNWLIGLHVDHLDRWRRYSASFKREPDPELPGDEATRLILDGRMNEADDGKWLFRKVEGRVCRTPGDMNNTDRVLVIWRKLTDNLEQDNLMLDEFFKHHYPSTAPRDVDVVYVNGSNNLQQLCEHDTHCEVRLIEQSFHQHMWDVQE